MFLRVILLVIFILVAAIISGSLGTALEIAAGVVLGLVLFVLGIGVAVWWYLRRRFQRFSQDLEGYRRDRPPDPRGPAPPTPRY